MKDSFIWFFKIENRSLIFISVSIVKGHIKRSHLRDKCYVWDEKKPKHRKGRNTIQDYDARSFNWCSAALLLQKLQILSHENPSKRRLKDIFNSRSLDVGLYYFLKSLRPTHDSRDPNSDIKNERELLGFLVAGLPQQVWLFCLQHGKVEGLSTTMLPKTSIRPI